jgi:hypothetical protein
MNGVAVYANYARLGMLALLPLVVLQVRCLVLGVFDIVIVERLSYIISVREGVTFRETLLMRHYLLGAQSTFVALAADHCTEPP